MWNDEGVKTGVEGVGTGLSRRSLDEGGPLCLPWADRKARIPGTDNLAAKADNPNFMEMELVIEEQKKGPGIRDLRGQIMKFLPLLLILLWPVAQAPAKEQEMKKNESVSDFAQYAVPQGWTIAEGTNQGDSQAALTRIC